MNIFLIIEKYLHKYPGSWMVFLYIHDTISIYLQGYNNYIVYMLIIIREGWGPEKLINLPDVVS